MPLPMHPLSIGRIPNKRSICVVLIGGGARRGHATKFQKNWTDFYLKVFLNLILLYSASPSHPQRPTVQYNVTKGGLVTTRQLYDTHTAL